MAFVDSKTRKEELLIAHSLIILQNCYWRRLSKVLKFMYKIILYMAEIFRIMVRSRSDSAGTRSGIKKKLHFNNPFL